MKTIADILRERNARISEGSYWLVWDDEDRLLGYWQIFKVERGKGVRVFEDTSESNAVAEFLRLTADEQEATND